VTYRHSFWTSLRQLKVYKHSWQNKRKKNVLVLNKELSRREKLYYFKCYQADHRSLSHKPFITSIVRLYH
jgi:hypothetical protein